MKFLLLLLPAVALASIEVQLSGIINFEKQYLAGNVNAKGIEKQAITDYDKSVFHIHDEYMKSEVEKYYGKKPDKIFLAPNIQVKIETDTPIDMVEIKSKKEVITQSIYENTHTTERKLIHIHESETKDDTVTSLWDHRRQDAASNVNVIINLEAENDVACVNHKFAFGLNRKILHKKTRSQSGSIILAPGQKVLAQLTAKKGTVTFQIPYKMSLSGGFQAYFNEAYNHENFHDFDLNLVMGNKTVTVYQVISYEFYYGLSLQIVKAEDGYSVLKSFAPEGGLSSGQKRRASAAKHAAETGKKITKKPPQVLIEFTEDDLKSIVEDKLVNQLDEESNESSEDKTTEKPENKTPLEVPKPE